MGLVLAEKDGRNKTSEIAAIVRASSSAKILFAFLKSGFLICVYPRSSAAKKPPGRYRYRY